MEFYGNTKYENRKHSTAFVPFSYYESRIPDFFPYVPMHSHAEWELNLFTDGSGCLFTDKTRLSVKEGEFVLVFPNTLHAIESDSRLIYDTVVFSTDMLGGTGDRCYAEVIAPLCGPASDIFYINREDHLYDRLHTAADNVVSCAKGNRARLDLLMKSELMQILWLAEESGALPPEDSDNGCLEIRSAIDYMNGHYEDSISIETLAQHTNLSKSWFMQQFKETVGVSAMEYLNRLRIKKVCECLLDGRGISESAFACGFRNLSNFNRIFKATVGATPSSYQKKARQPSG